MSTENKQWNLEDFIDSLVVELDKTRETLAVKSINKPLSYSVKDMSMDLNIFPTYDGDQVRFVTAQPGQEGASKVTIQLGSITDQQVRATSKITGLKNDISIDKLNIDTASKRKLRKIGVTTADDIKQIESRNIDINKVSDDTVDYTAIANQIQKAKRNQSPPKVKGIAMSVDENRKPYFIVSGQNLAVNERFRPVAIINNRLAEVMSYNEDEIKIQLHKDHEIGKDNEVVLTIDPFAIIKLNVKV